MACLFDTDVMIDALRGLEPAVEFVEAHRKQASLSVITVAQIYAGARENEFQAISRTLSLFKILTVTPAIAEKGGLFSGIYTKTHGCDLADCLIAATAEIHGQTLYTRNVSHFPMLRARRAYKLKTRR